MRQKLFLILFDQPFAFWSTEPETGLPGIGLTIMLLLLGAIFLGTTLIRTGGQIPKDERFLVIIWLAFTVASMFGLRSILPFLPSAVPLFGYGAMLVIALITGALWASHRAKAVGLDPQIVWDLAFVIVISGIVGARAWYIAQYPDRVFADAKTIPQMVQAAFDLPSGGIVLYGGVLAGGIAFALFCYLRKVPVLQVADVVTPSVFLGLGFGRLGCFLNGCCFGDPCTLPWSVEFPAGTVPYSVYEMRGYLVPGAAATMPLHPSQIYSSLNGFLLAAVTGAYFWRRGHVGEVLALGWIIYPITRFLLERVRGDELGQFNTALTISQWGSFVVCGAGILFVLSLRFFPRQSSTNAETVQISPSAST